jgi:DNA-binding winged helix-turn-helix (wHTH) protein
VTLHFPAPEATESFASPTIGDGSEVRGFALYIGLSETRARSVGIDLGILLEALRRRLAEVAPVAESHAAAVLAPANVSKAPDLELVLSALGARARGNALGARASERAPGARAREGAAHTLPLADEGVTIDIARHDVRVGGHAIHLTFMEFALLHNLVSNEGVTLSRRHLQAALATRAQAGGLRERAIDVHVGRLRSKLGAFSHIVQTVHGHGYRYDRRLDVTVVSEDEPRAR